jgi:hypothetical protein
MSKARVLSYLLDTLPRMRSIRAARLWDENSVLVKMHLGERIAIYCLDESLFSIPLMTRALKTNTCRDIHTLFIVMQDLLPHNGTVTRPGEALSLLMAVYNNKVYAARAVGEVVIFPVHFDESLKATYGKPVDLADLSGDYALIENPHLHGVHHIADFERTYYHAEHYASASPGRRHPLQQYYERLGVECDAPEDIVKRAYREKAHLYHPDRNTSPDATYQMQLINEAYEQIMKQWK